MNTRKFTVNGTKFYKHPVYSDYASSKSGKIFSLKDNRETKTFFNGAYYLFTIINERKPMFYELDRFVYECVKRTRIPGCKVIHLDENKKNNHITNLDIEELEEL